MSFKHKKIIKIIFQNSELIIFQNNNIFKLYNLSYFHKIMQKYFTLVPSFTQLTSINRVLMDWKNLTDQAQAFLRPLFYPSLLLF